MTAAGEIGVGGLAKRVTMSRVESNWGGGGGACDGVRWLPASDEGSNRRPDDAGQEGSRQSRKAIEVSVSIEGGGRERRRRGAKEERKAYRAQTAGVGGGRRARKRSGKRKKDGKKESTGREVKRARGWSSWPDPVSPRLATIARCWPRMPRRPLLPVRRWRMACVPAAWAWTAARMRMPTAHAAAGRSATTAVVPPRPRVR